MSKAGARVIKLMDKDRKTFGSPLIKKDRGQKQLITFSYYKLFTFILKPQFGFKQCKKSF
jgi:hypothetical protein